MRVRRSLTKAENMELLDLLRATHPIFRDMVAQKYLDSKEIVLFRDEVPRIDNFEEMDLFEQPD